MSSQDQSPLVSRASAGRSEDWTDQKTKTSESWFVEVMDFSSDNEQILCFGPCLMESVLAVVLMDPTIDLFRKTASSSISGTNRQNPLGVVFYKFCNQKGFSEAFFSVFPAFTKCQNPFLLQMSGNLNGKGF